MTVTVKKICFRPCAALVIILALGAARPLQADSGLAGVYSTYASTYSSWSLYNGMYALYLDSYDLYPCYSVDAARLFMESARDNAAIAYNHALNAYYANPNSTTLNGSTNAFDDWNYKGLAAGNLSNLTNICFSGGDSFAETNSAIITSYLGDCYNGYAIYYSGAVP